MGLDVYDSVLLARNSVKPVQEWVGCVGAKGLPRATIARVGQS